MLAVGLACVFLTVWMFVLSLMTLFRKPRFKGIVEERLDLALEVEMMVESIERIANEE